MWGLLALIVVPVSGWLVQRRAEARDRKRYPAPGRMIDVDGINIHVVVEGSGPVVLLDSGLGGCSTEWERVAADLSRDFTVIRYDRPAFGWSPAAKVDTSPQAAANRIAAILRALDLPGRAILVGHSLGGLHVRMTALLHPQLVAGLVLVDPSDEDMLASPMAARSAAISARVMSALATTAPLGSARVIGRLFARMVSGQVHRVLPAEERDALKCATLLNACSVTGLRAAVAEIGALPASLRQVKELSQGKKFPPIPVILISADAAPRNERERTARATVRELHEAQIAGLPAGRLVLAADSGHLVPLDQPELIAECVREVACTH